MSVRFILGRAGSGKTHYCIDSVRRHLSDGNRIHPRLILLVPEQASIQTERALLACSGVSGTARGEVLSFRRLALRILQDQPGQGEQVLSTVGRAMVVQKLLTDSGPRMKYFRCPRLLPGLCSQLAGQLEEFIESSITPDALAADRPSSEALRLKMHDLELIYRQYLSYLDQGYRDPVMFLDQARQYIRPAAWLVGARVWVDGFASFSRQELNFLVDLATHVAEMEICLMIDPERIAGPAEPFSLFEQTEQTYAQMLEVLSARGIVIKSPLTLTESSAPDRSADLQHLESNIFASMKPSDELPQNIEVYAAEDPRDEIEQVIERLVALTRRSRDPLRYRDIAIVKRHLGDDHFLISGALERYQIPYFIDRRRPLNEHPLHHLLVAILNSAQTSWSLESARQLLKCDLLGLEPYSLDQIENYILAHQITGLESWTAGDWTADPTGRVRFNEEEESVATERLLKHINATRLRLTQQFEPWIKALDLGGRRIPGRHWAAMLYECLESLRVPQRIENWAALAEHNGQTVDAEQHRQAWRCLVRMFDDFDAALGNAPINLHDFLSTFQSGLQNLDTGLIPAAVDQVVVGSVARSRQPYIRAAFLLGMNDGTFPLTESEQTLLGDDDRKRLRAGGLSIDPPRSARLGEERLLAYIAMTRPGEYLHISYCANDLQGRKLEPSPYLQDLAEIFPKLHHSRSRKEDPIRSLDRIHSAADLVDHLALRIGRNVMDPGGAGSDLWNGVYLRSRSDNKLRKPLRQTLQSLVENNNAELSETAPPDTLEISISDIETFSACPFRYFSRSVLRLLPRPTGDVDVLRLGTLYHTVLEQFMVQLSQAGLKISDLSDSELATRLRECTTHLNERLHASLGEEQQSFLWHRLHEELGMALAAQRHFQEAGQYGNTANEFCFGMPDGASPGVEILTPGKKRILLRGKIDRIDTAKKEDETVGFVFDYKRSRNKTLKYTELYHGLNLQLIAYLLAFRTVSGELVGASARPGGAFYLCLIPDYDDVEHPQEATSGQFKAYRPRGVFNENDLHLLDKSLTPGNSSEVIAARINKDGEVSLANNNDAVGAGDLQRIMEYASDRIGAFCDRILDGEISVSPYRLGRKMPCSWCDYRIVCRFEFPQNQARDLDSVRKSEMLEQLSKP